MSVHLYLAFRALLRSRLSFALLVAAVAAGLAFQVPNTANLDGYTAELLRKGVPPDAGDLVMASPDGAPFDGAGALAERVRQQPSIRAARARLVLAGSCFAGERLTTARVVGLDPAAAPPAAEGRGPEAGGALLGRRVAEDLGLRPGDAFTLALPRMEDGQVRVAAADLRVAGLLAGTGGFRADHEVYLPLAALRDLVGRPDAATEIRVDVAPGSAPGPAEALRRLAPGLRTEPTWGEQPFVRSAVEANRALSLISTAMVVAAVLIPVLALLYIHVLSERRRIAVLAALGFGRADLFAIHLLQALIVGCLGTALGSAAGWGLCRWFLRHPIFANAGFVVRPSLSAHAFLAPGGVLLLTSLAAGVVPAVLAARAEPAEALRES